MAGCGIMLVASMSIAPAAGSSYSFIPPRLLERGGGGTKHCRRIRGDCLFSHSFESQFARSVPKRWNWNSPRWCCQPRAAAYGTSNDGRRKNAPSAQNGQARGSSEKKVDRKQRDNVWSSGEGERTARASSKKESGGSRDGAKSKSNRKSAADSARSAPAPGEKKNIRDHEEEELEFLKYLSPQLPIENEKVVHPEESFASPLWSTFCSSVSGVWRGVAAAFSPITAELEALYLSKQNEYLYDARILNTVEVIRTQDGQKLPLDKHYLSRRVLWSLENPLGENGLGEVTVAKDADGENARLNAFLGKGPPNATASYPDDEEDLGYWTDDEEDEDETSEYDAQWESLVGTEEDIDARWEDGKPDKLDVMPELKVDVGSMSEDAKEWKAIWDRKEVLEGDWERVTSPMGEMAPPPLIPSTTGESTYSPEHLTNALGTTWADGTAPPSLVPPSTGGPTYSPEHLTDALGTTWADVMEEDVMDQEAGLVYFEDGSYSRGPLELLTDASTSGREYFNGFTCKIEQCLVAGGHKRLRVVHTVQVESEGEQVEVLRVAVYEEEWMGPCNMKSISDVGGQELNLYSARPRHSPQELAGAWKIFEKEALAYIPPKNSAEKPSFSHSSREITITRGLPEMPEECPDYDPQDEDEPVDMTEFSMLWLTGGVSTYVAIDEETGMLTFGVGWLTATGSRLVLERTYDEDGKLLHVKSKTEIGASLGVPM